MGRQRLPQPVLMLSHILRSPGDLSVASYYPAELFGFQPSSCPRPGVCRTTTTQPAWPALRTQQLPTLAGVGGGWATHARAGGRPV